MSQPQAALEGFQPTSQYVICIDDDQDFLSSLEIFLPDAINEARGPDVWYRFLFSSDPQDALALLQELQDDGAVVAMIVCDQKMPGMLGTELLARAKAVCDAVRVLLTGHAGMESAIVAINEGLLDRYLTKPIDNQHEFVLTLSHLLHRFELDQTVASQNQALQSLYDFSDRINALRSYEETARFLAAFAKEAIGCHCVKLFLWKGSVLELVTSLGDGPGGGGDVPDPACIDSATFEGEFPGVDPGRRATDAFPYRPHLFGPEGTRDGLVACLVHSDGPVGVIIAFGREDGTSFGPSDRKILACIANTGAIALRNQQGRLRLQGLLEDAQHRSRELAEAKRRAETLDRLKSDFLTFISHELRTPLAQISAVSLIEPSGGPENRELLAAVQGGYDRLETLVLQGLDYFESLALDGIAKAGAVDLVDVVRSTSDRIAVDSAATEWVLPDGPCFVRFLESRLAQVVSILLDNAIKFSPGEKQIRTEVQRGDGVVSLTVRDQGVGFSHAVGEQLLRPFTVGNIRNHSRGSALSLAKATALVEAFGGTIEARSPGEGCGAAFSITLPTLEAEEAA
ncbi:MAG: response regulator [Candidatus Eisenbacteria bacterium]|nr:response regulator [Candidatus Eisenbacteria bacterium]